MWFEVKNVVQLRAGRGQVFDVSNVLINWPFRDDVDDCISAAAKSTSQV